MNKIILILSFFTLVCCNGLGDRYKIAGKNKREIKRAIKSIPKEYTDGMEWLVLHMPDNDLKTLSSNFLIENVINAYESLNEAPWKEDIPQHIFFNYILPYANLNERRESWRNQFRAKFKSLIKNSKTPYEAAATLNNTIFSELGVKYSTERKKADQSPSETIETGLASCTGLSILLIDVCRSLGIPARFVGTSMWYNDSGNHSWVEIWDGEWYFTGAAEPTKNKLNEGWFILNASKAIEGDQKYGIYASTWSKSESYFSMDWLPEVKIYNAIEVTRKYKILDQNKNLMPVQIRVVDQNGFKVSEEVVIIGENDFQLIKKSKDSSSDKNDHLIVNLPIGNTYKVTSGESSCQLHVKKENLLNLVVKNH